MSPRYFHYRFECRARLVLAVGVAESTHEAFAKAGSRSEKPCTLLVIADCCRPEALAPNFKDPQTQRPRASHSQLPKQGGRGQGGVSREHPSDTAHGLSMDMAGAARQGPTNAKQAKHFSKRMPCCLRVLFSNPQPTPLRMFGHHMLDNVQDRGFQPIKELAV